MLRALRFLVALWTALALTATPAEAASPGRLLVTGGGAPGWTLPPVRGNGVDLNFSKGLYYLKGATGPLANSRLTNETCFTSGGNLVQVGPNQNCVTDIGVGAWEGRTNSIPNNTMVGAVAGTPGTMPTGWSQSAAATGVSFQNLGTSTIGGMTALTLRSWSPTTPSATAWFDIARFSSTTAVNATYGQTLTLSVYWQLIAGSAVPLSNSGFRTGLYVYDGSSTYLGVIPGTWWVPTNATLGTQRISDSFTVSYPTAAYVRPYLTFEPINGAAYDVTIALALPDLENNPNLLAGVASATKVSGGNSGTPLNSSGNSVLITGGTCTTQPVAQVSIDGSGAVSNVTGIVVPGQCSVLPPSPATLVGHNLSGATVNPVPVNNAAQAFPTMPILTTNGALARAPDNITIPTKPCLNPSLLAVGIPAAPNASLGTSVIAEIDDGSFNNRLNEYRYNGSPWSFLNISGAGYGTSPTGSWAQGVAGKITQVDLGSIAASKFNGAGLNSTPVPAMTPLTGVEIGSALGGFQWNGTISRVAVSCGQSLLNQ